MLKNFDINSPMREIYNAIESQNINRLREMLRSPIHKNQLSWETWDRWSAGWEEYPVETLTPLEEATILGNLETIKLLLEVGRDLPDWRFPLNRALCRVCESGNLELAKIFIEAKTELGHIKGTIHMKDPSFFEASIRGRNLDMVRLLIECDFDVNGVQGGFTPLMSAVITNNLSIAKILIKTGANVNQTDDSQWKTAIILAAYYGNQEMFDYLEPLTSPEALQIAKDSFGRFVHTINFDQKNHNIFQKESCF